MEESVLNATNSSDAGLNATNSFDAELVCRLADLEEKKWHTQTYNKSVSQINWEQVAFKDHSAEECKAQWERIENRLRVTRTLPELLADARASNWDPVRMRKARKLQLRADGAPSQPLSAYMMFAADTRPKLMRKHPELTIQEVMRLIGEKFHALSEKKRAVYDARRAAAQEEYRAKMAAFSEEHPQAAGPPQEPRSAVFYYRRKHPELSAKQARAAIAGMSVEDRFRYIRRAQRALQRYQKEVEAYQALYPDWRPRRATPRTLSKADKRALDEADGKVPPPRRAYDIFRKDAGLMDSQEVARRWRALDAADRAQYQQTADQEKQRYEAYLASLPAEVQQQVRKPRRRKQKKLTGKMLYMQEKMPKVFDGGVSEEDWRRVLSNKFNKLHPDDKEAYKRRAEEMNGEDALAGNEEAYKRRAEEMNGEDALAGNEEAYKRRAEEMNGEDALAGNEPVVQGLTSETEQETESITPKKKKRKKAAQQEQSEGTSTPVKVEATSRQAQVEATSTPVQVALSDEPPRTPLDYFTALYLKKKGDQGGSAKKQRKEAKKLWKGLDAHLRSKVETMFQKKFGNKS